MRKTILAVSLATVVGTAAAQAAPSTLFDDVVTVDDTIAAPAGATAALAGPLGLVGGLQSGAITVTAPGNGQLTITVADFGEVGDVFQVFSDGVALGTTSHVPVDGPVNSTGVFSLAAGAGVHTVDIWDYILSYEGANSPYGGAVDSTFSPADLEVAVTFNAVAEPSSAALAMTGVLALGLALRHRARSVRDVQHP